MSNIFNINIDGKNIKVKKGMTILDAAKKAKIEIPTLCYHPDLTAAGICRVCVVEIEGMRTLQTACTYEVFPNMKVLTYSSKIRKARRHSILLMLH